MWTGSRSGSATGSLTRVRREMEIAKVPVIPLFVIADSIRNPAHQRLHGCPRIGVRGRLIESGMTTASQQFPSPLAQLAQLQRQAGQRTAPSRAKSLIAFIAEGAQIKKILDPSVWTHKPLAYPRHAGHRCGTSVMRRGARVSKSSQTGYPTGMRRRNPHPTMRSISASTGD